MFKPNMFNSNTFKLICVTNRRLCREDFSLRLAKIAAAGPDAIILREKDLPAAAYRRLAEQALAICGEYGVPCLLHGFARQAAELGAPALHMPLPQLARLSEAERRRFACLGASCHSLAELQAAQRLGCSYITAGHIFATACKPGQPGRGLFFLQQICAAAQVPVWAIGGIAAANLAQVQAAGAAGACLMSSLMTCPEPAALIQLLRSSLPERA